jgi:M6 family metalloprotease-like protein
MIQRTASANTRRIARFAGILLVVTSSMCQLRGQSSELSERVRGFNNSVLELHGRMRSEAQTATSRQSGLATLRNRAAALRALARQNPAEALRQSFAPEALNELATAFPGSAGLLESHGVWRGETETIVEDSADMKTHRVVHYLRTGNGTVEVHVAGVEPETSCGDIVEFEGVRFGDVVAAISSEVVAAAVAPCGPTGEQKIAVLMVTFPGVAPPSNVTAQGVKDIMTATTGRSVDGFWREASYGKAWATADVYGWYTLDDAYGCDSTSLLRAAAIQAADADVYFPNYSRVMILFPTPVGGCSFAGSANLGCTTLSSPGDGSFSSSYNYMIASYFSSRDQGVKLTTHEGGHNLGLMHSRSRDFGAETLGGLGASGTLSEYGDTHSTMGSWNLGHYTGSQKLKLGWQADAANVVTVQGTGTFTIQATETPTVLPQTLKIQRGTGNNAWLWVEYRQPIGSYDSTLNSQIFSGALIHYQDSVTGTYTDLLDFTGGTSSFADAALAVGQTWVDSYSNVSIYVQSANASGLTVAVNYGTVPCAPANPTVTMTPLNPGVYSGSSVTYLVTVRNNDSSGCSTSAFTIGSSQPAAWTPGLSVVSLALSPGQSGVVTLTENVPAGTTPGTYPVGASASRDGSIGTASASCTVIAPPLPLTVTVASGASSYAAKSTVTLTAQALSGSAPVSGASVKFTVSEPNGSTTVKSVLTGSNGAAILSYKLTPKDSAGSYSVMATATYGAQTATGGPATFVVK